VGNPLQASPPRRTEADFPARRGQPEFIEGTGLGPAHHSEHLGRPDCLQSAIRFGRL